MFALLKQPDAHDKEVSPCPTPHSVSLLRRLALCFFFSRRSALNHQQGRVCDPSPSLRLIALDMRIASSNDSADVRVLRWFVFALREFSNVAKVNAGQIHLSPVPRRIIIKRNSSRAHCQSCKDEIIVQTQIILSGALPKIGTNIKLQPKCSQQFKKTFFLNSTNFPIKPLCFTAAKQ